MKSAIIACAFVSFITVVGQPVAALATTITFNTPNGTKLDDGRPVSAEATLTTTTDLVTVTVRNLQTSIKDIEQTISGISFALDNLKTGTTVVSSAGLERTVHSNKSFTDGASVPTGWIVLLDGQSMQLMLPDPVTDHTIIGPASGSSYSNANSTIAGNADNNPFLYGPVTFSIKVPGITSSTHVDWATFHFGVCAQYIPLCVTNVPEPGTITTFALGAFGLIATVATKRRKRAA